MIIAEPIPHPQMLSGVVLAGGQSTRLGRDKGLALLKARPLVLHVAHTLSELADEVVISVAKGMKMRYQDATFSEFDVVEDSTDGVGPLQGLISSFEVVNGDLVMVSPCDTPFLKTSVCRAVIERAPGHDAAVPVVHGQFEPLHAAYRRESSLRAFKGAVAIGKRRIIEAYDKLRIARVEEDVLRSVDPELESFWNLNRPEDLEEAERRTNRV